MEILLLVSQIILVILFMVGIVVVAFGALLSLTWAMSHWEEFITIAFTTGIVYFAALMSDYVLFGQETTAPYIAGLALIGLVVFIVRAANKKKS